MSKHTHTHTQEGGGLMNLSEFKRKVVEELLDSDIPRHFAEAAVEDNPDLESDWLHGRSTSLVAGDIVSDYQNEEV